VEKFYHATRSLKGCTITVECGISIVLLNLRNELRNHSSEGGSWGYGGSGPAQLALALCCDALGDDQRALAVYQQFKNTILAKEERTAWTLTQKEVLDTIYGLELLQTSRDLLNSVKSQMVPGGNFGPQNASQQPSDEDDRSTHGVME